jgi:hypothetical protein
MAGQIVHDDKPCRLINPLLISSSVRVIIVNSATSVASYGDDVGR